MPCLRRFLPFGLVVFLLTMTSPGLAATMKGWDIGWNDMATVEPSDNAEAITKNYDSSGSVLSFSLSRWNVSFSTADFFNGYFSTLGTSYSWADATGDQGQHFFDGTLRQSGYTGSVPLLTAYDWDGSQGQTASGAYEWLINNYDRDQNGDPVGDPKNSWIRGTGSSPLTYLPLNQFTGDFEANLASTGTFYWYTPATPDSPMSGWLQNWDWTWDVNGDFSDYYRRYMTGNFRLIGDYFGAEATTAFFDITLQYEVAVAPIPEVGTVTLLGFGLAGLGLFGYRRNMRS